MKQNIKTYLLTLYAVVLSCGIFAQEFKLKIISKDSLESKFLQSLNYKQKHLSEKSIYTQTTLISENLKSLGYFLNTIDSIVKKDTVYCSYFSLKKKTKKVFIKVPKNKIKIVNYNINNGIAEIDVENLSSFMASISNTLDKEGKSFSEVKLTNIQLKDNLLFADLEIHPTNKRTIDRVIIKGYENFSKSHINHYLNIKKRTVFNQQKLKEISTSIQSLDFVSEIKPPEVLFSKDSTIIYIYLKKSKVNRFDGLVNFTTKNNGKGLLFNGHLDLKLANILDTGEQFKLFWKANGEERQLFEIAAELPFVFNSAFTPDISFSIYKQDSTFLNTKFHSKITYNFNPKMSVALTYTSENSENTLQNNNNAMVQDFDNSFLGGQFTYRISNNVTFKNDILFLSVNPSFGSRNNQQTEKTNQFKINLEASSLWQLNTRSAIFLKNQTGYLNSDTFLENELYRIGGANSIRGFNEQSIFTSQFSYFNLEYRYLIATDSYLYSISDIGRIKTINSGFENIYGVGFGYLFRVKSSQINLGYVLGKSSNQNFDFQNSKLIIIFKSYF